MNDEIDLRVVRQRVKKGVEKQKRLTNSFLFGLNVFMFILFMIIAFGIYASGDGNSLSNIFSSTGHIEDPTLEAMIMLSTGWFTSLVFHGLSLFFNTKWGERQIRNRVIASELGRELFELDTDEEPLEKQKRMVQLVEDGEFEEGEEIEDAELMAHIDKQMRSSNSS